MALLGSLAGGCAAIPDRIVEPQFHNPFPQLHRVAVLPFFNQSAEPTVDGDAVAIAYYNELQQIPGFEVMPVGEFPGTYGWGYDVVHFFAPTRLYGTPDDMRAFVDAAHAARLGVILDVVYNHFGPTGNYTGRFSETYVSKKRSTEWGESINFDGESAQSVREFVTSNAACWIREFHLDGLRYLQPILPAAPTTIIHGRQDEVVAIEHSREYTAHFPDQVHLVEVDADHQLSDQLAFIWQQVQSFLLSDNEPPSD